MVACIALEGIILRNGSQKHESLDLNIILLRTYLENVLGMIMRIKGFSQGVAIYCHGDENFRGSRHVNEWRKVPCAIHSVTQRRELVGFECYTA